MAKVGHTMCHMIYTLKTKVVTDNEDLCILLFVVFPLSYSCKPHTINIRQKCSEVIALMLSGWT